MSPVLSIVSTLAVAATALAAALTTPTEVPPTARATPPDVQLRFAETEPAPGLARIEGSGRVLYLQPQAVLTTPDIASAVLGTDPLRGKPGRRTDADPGRPQPLGPCHQRPCRRNPRRADRWDPGDSPIIREPILGGRVQISGLMTVAEATDLGRLLGAVARDRSPADALKGRLGRRRST
jgi:preprotein translocase subunit SecD